MLDLEDFPISWQEQPVMLTPQEAQQPSAPLFMLIVLIICWSQAASNMAIWIKVLAHQLKASLTVTTAYVEHAPIEPEAGAAWLEEGCWWSRLAQAPVMDQEDTAKILGLALDKVRIIPAATGGGFGTKLDVSLQPLLGLAVLKTGKPCRMVYSRQNR